MKAVALMVTGAVGLAVGALFGTADRRTTLAAPTNAVTKVHEGKAGTDGVLGGQLAFASDDERIVRVFSALQEPLALKKRFELFEALRGLTAHDFSALVKRAESFPFIRRNELVPPLLDRWFELDFDAAQSWMRVHPTEFMAIEAWAKANPEKALREAFAMQDDWRATSLLYQAIRQLAGDDHAAQAARLKTLASSKLRDDVFQSVLADWAKTDPAAAYAALAEIPPGRTHDGARDGVLRNWAERDPAGALAQVNALLPMLKAGVLGNELVTDLAERVGKKDPRLVLEWLSELPVEFRAAPAIGAARVWAAKDPAAALDWCLANGVDVARGRRMGFNSWQAGVLGEALAAHPDLAVAWLEGLRAGPDRDRLLERALQDSLWRVPKEQLFDEDNAFAMRLFNELAAESQVRAATALGEKRAQQGDLTDLHDWAENFTVDAARANAIAGAMAATYERDASRVEPLLASSTSPADRDAALRGLAGAMSNSAPAEAAARALAINDPALRRETLGTIVSAWKTRDPDAAVAWLRDSAGIPEAWKQSWQRTP